ncbi:AMP-binding enzyme [Mycolicibacterium vanbaalenii]|uniref:AMP-binding enzyme n=1 Tax=Mycolicibacterium vanbaalenii TaxID=110539 RepID=UPI0035C68A9C
MELPGVREAAVVGVRDDDFGMCLRAFVVPAAGADIDADQIRHAVRSRLARHKVPRDVLFVDALPRNETGKVLKRDLARMEQR